MHHCESGIAILVWTMEASFEITLAFQPIICYVLCNNCNWFRTPEFRSISTVLLKVQREEGVLALYRGLAPSMFGVMLYAGTSFFIFGTLKVTYLLIGNINFRNCKLCFLCDYDFYYELEHNWSSINSIFYYFVYEGSRSSAQWRRGSHIYSASSCRSSSWTYRSNHQLSSRYSQVGVVTGLICQTTSYPLDIVR